MAKPRMTVIEESATGRNEKYHDNKTGAVLTRTKFVRAIEQGLYDDFHVRVINGKKTPVSNPDGIKGNNLD